MNHITETQIFHQNYQLSLALQFKWVGYSSGLMALPNNAICVYAAGGHNEKAGNGLFDHLPPHI